MEHRALEAFLIDLREGFTSGTLQPIGESLLSTDTFKSVCVYLTRYLGKTVIEAMEQRSTPFVHSYNLLSMPILLLPRYPFFF